MRDQSQLPLASAVAAARAAGAAVMPFYGTALEAERKDDGSPVTRADRAAHQVIMSCLGRTALPVVSEEGDAHDLDATTYWLVDPLDGTKDFLAANGEFTVNIALIEDGRPVLGVVYAPALDELYAGVAGHGSRCERNGASRAIPSPARSARLRMATSRFN